MDAMFNTTTVTADHQDMVATAIAASVLAEATVDLAPAAAKEGSSIGQDDLERNVSLSDLLAERHAVFLDLNRKADAGDTEAADLGMEVLGRIETAIIGTDAVSLDDVIAKLALVAAHDREGLCFDQDLLFGLTVEAQTLFLKSAAPGMVLPPPRVGHWVFVPTDGLVPPRPAAPTPPAELAAIIARAAAYKASNYDPASKSHSAAESAYFAMPLGERSTEVEAENEHLNTIQLAEADKVYALIRAVLDVKPSTVADMYAAAKAYADFVSSFAGEWLNNPEAHQRLCRDHQVELLDYLFRAMGDLSGNASVNPTNHLPGDDAQLVADGGASWASAVSRFEAATETLKLAREAEDQAEASVDLAAPMPDILVIERHADGRVHRSYFTAEAIERDFNLPHQCRVKEMMLAAQAAWQQEEEAAKARFRLADMKSAREAAFDAWRAAFYLVAELTPPDADALVYKARVLILDECFDEEGCDLSKEQLDMLLSRDGPEYVVGKLYQDLVAMAGQRAPEPTEGMISGREAIRAAWNAAREVSLSKVAA